MKVSVVVKVAQDLRDRLGPEELKNHIKSMAAKELADKIMESGFLRVKSAERYELERVIACEFSVDITNNDNKGSISADKTYGGNIDFTYGRAPTFTWSKDTCV
jgi:hypothetical protein